MPLFGGAEGDGRPTLTEEGYLICPPGENIEQENVHLWREVEIKLKYMCLYTDYICLFGIVYNVHNSSSFWLCGCNSYWSGENCWPGNPVVAIICDVVEDCGGEILGCEARGCEWVYMWLRNAGCSAITNKQNSFLAGMMVFISGDGHSIQTRVVTHCVV